MTDGATRTHFFAGQFLRAQDFVEEQAYHLALHRRHNIAHHSWGIVEGLDLVADQEGNLVLEPGVAVDGFGRELVLAERQQVGRQPFDDRAASVLDLYLNYDRSGSDAAPMGYGGCEEEDAAFYRWQEHPFLTYEEPAPPPVDRRRPNGVDETDLHFTARGTPPDEPERRWPVFLGQVTLDRANQGQPFSVDLTGRPYAGLVGGSIRAPSGRTTVQIGSEHADDPYRFAVYLHDTESCDPQGARDTQEAKDAQAPRLAITKDGSLEIRAETAVHGNLTLDGALDINPGRERASQAEETPRIYRLENELRVEMTAAGKQEVVIGTWSAAHEQFQPCLTIANDGTVTVHGDLIIEGQLQGWTEHVESNVVDLGLGPEAHLLALSAFASGIAGATPLIGTRRAGPPSEPTVAPLAALQIAAQSITGSREGTEVFADLLKRAHPETAETLRQALAVEAEPEDSAS